MDIWIATDPENASAVIEALRDFGFDLPDLTGDLFLEPDSTIRFGNPPFRIELLTGISGVAFAECYAARVTDTIDGVEVPIISLNHLKLNKGASARHKDLDDLEHLP